ncbi:MAG: DUF5518 domain-containing protein [Methanobacteriaceae archaeon]
MGFGFIVTLVLAYLGNYVPYLDIPIAPLIGGIIVGYVVGGSYKNGIINGGLSAGLVGFLYTLMVIVLVTGNTISTAVAAYVAPTAFSGESGIFTAIIIIIGAFLASIIYFILGLIGGIIGVAIKERGTEKPKPSTSTGHEKPLIPL